MNRVKVGIMTLYFNTNYGATLQAYALHKTIEEMGFACEDIRYYREINGRSTKTHVDRHRKLTVQRIVKFLSIKLINILFCKRTAYVARGVALREVKFYDFISRNIAESKESYDGHREIHKASCKYDIFVCGSDNIWNKNLLDTSFFLDFVPNNTPKIAYAPGMSYNTANDSILKIIAPLINRFDSISVREESGKQLINRLVGHDAFLALDPTLLRTKDQWNQVLTEVPVENQPYILCYFFGTGKLPRSFARELSLQTGLRIITLPFMSKLYFNNDYKFGDLQLFDIGPAEFISLIANAAYVCTDSFHGTIFSIIYEKEFYCFRRFFKGSTVSLNSRIDSLLSRFGIEGRVICNSRNVRDTVTALIKNPPIDYNLISQQLGILRNESIDFLKRSLYNAKNRVLEKECKNDEFN